MGFKTALQLHQDAWDQLQLISYITGYNRKEVFTQLIEEDPSHPIEHPGPTTRRMVDMEKTTNNQLKLLAYQWGTTRDQIIERLTFPLYKRAVKQKNREDAMIGKLKALIHEYADTPLAVKLAKELNLGEDPTWTKN